MPLFESIVFLDIVKVVSPEDNSSLHLLALHNPCENSSADAHIASEWAFLVNVGPLNSLHWRIGKW